MRSQHQPPRAAHGPASRVRRTWAPGAFLALVLVYSWSLEFVAVLLGGGWTRGPVLGLFVTATIGPALIASLLVLAGWADIDLRTFWHRAVDVRSITLLWYLVVLTMATAPMLAGRLVTVGLTAGWTVSALAPGFLVVGVLAGLAEEPGWRGYAQHGLQRRVPVAAAGLLIGVIWALWHVPLAFVEGTYQQQLGFGTAAFWLYLLAILAQSVIYAWIYRATGSVFATVLFHAAVNVAGEVVSVDAAAGYELAFWTLLAVSLVALDRRMRRPFR